MRISILHSLAELEKPEWEDLTHDADTDSGYGYLQFREYLEPGDNLVLAARRSGQLVGALHGALTADSSGMASNPWKFLAADSVLRIDEAEEAGSDVRRMHRSLVLGTDEEGADYPLWQDLSEKFGPCYVVRGFDRSTLMVRPDVPAAEAQDLAISLLRAAQQAALSVGAGAVAFPFVTEADNVLRNALAHCGFCCGVVTAASSFWTEGCTNYADYLDRLPSRYRRRYRVEEQRLEQSGLKTRELDVTEYAARIAELETRTLGKHGGSADTEALRCARIELGRILPGAVRVPAVEQDGSIIACALHLLGRHSSLFMSYGCDYSVPDRSSSYAWASFYYPVRAAVAHGARAVRLGFEGLEAKSQRGAVVEPREMWVWAPDDGDRAALGDLLSFLNERNITYLARFAR